MSYKYDKYDNRTIYQKVFRQKYSEYREHKEDQTSAKSKNPSNLLCDTHRARRSNSVSRSMNFIEYNKTKVSKPIKPYNYQRPGSGIPQKPRKEEKELEQKKTRRPPVCIKRPSSAMPTNHSQKVTEKSNSNLNSVSNKLNESLDYYSYDTLKKSEMLSNVKDVVQCHDDNESNELRATSLEARFWCQIRKRSFLKFRRIYEYSKPLRIKNSEYFFKFHSENSLVRFTLEDNGFREVGCDRHEPTLIWSNFSSQCFSYAALGRFQKFNHFPSSYELTRKDNLYRNLVRMIGHFGRKHFNFIPLTFLMPNDSGLLANEMFKDPNKWWIAKPSNKAQGKGIFLTKKYSEVKNKSMYVVSEYIPNPLLVDDFKFDIRLYVVVTSYNPLKIYLYEEGLVRFSCEKYENPDETGSNLYKHLTNYSINKHHNNFCENEDADDDSKGNKWSYTAFLKFLTKNNVNIAELQTEINKIIVKSFISVEKVINLNISNHVPFKSNIFEIYGFDILIDDHMKPYLLEVNLSPSLACGSPLDLKIKGGLIRDTFNLVGFVSNETRDYVTKYDKNPSRPGSMVNNYVATNYGKSLFKPPVSGSFKDERETWKEFGEMLKSEYNLDMNGITREERYIIKDYEEELQRMNNFSCLFPCRDYSEYKQFFEEDRFMNALLSNKFRKTKVINPGRRPSSAFQRRYTQKVSKKKEKREEYDLNNVSTFDGE